MKANDFNKKGTEAEQLIASLCNDSYSAEFCFLNPYYAPGKELCDVLLVLGDVAIIWQIKNLKLVDEKFNENEFNKNIRQCRGAKRKLLAVDSLTLKNTEGKEKTIYPKNLKTVHLISAIEGGYELSSRYYDEAVGGNVHIFFEGFTRFATEHFNTVADLAAYLAKKEDFLSKTANLILGGGEEDFAAVYLKNNRTFGNMENTNATMMFYDGEGAAQDLINDEEYKEKLEADHWSKGWDHLIEMRRKGIAFEPQDGDEKYRDDILMKMMSHNRLERRYLGQLFFEGAKESLQHQGGPGFIYRKYIPMEGFTYVFAYFGDENTSQEVRHKMLNISALLAREKFPKNETVIGILTEKDMLEHETIGYEWIGMMIPEAEMVHYQPQLDQFKALAPKPTGQLKMAKYFEYPADYRDFVNKNKKKSTKKKRKKKRKK
jgi:hypothetical protein